MAVVRAIETRHYNNVWTTVLFQIFRKHFLWIICVLKWEYIQIWHLSDLYITPNSNMDCQFSHRLRFYLLPVPILYWLERVISLWPSLSKMQTELKYGARFPESLMSLWSETRNRCQSKISASTGLTETNTDQAMLGFHTFQVPHSI